MACATAYAIASVLTLRPRRNAETGAIRLSVLPAEDTKRLLDSVDIKPEGSGDA